MKTEYASTFLRDLKATKDRRTLERVEEVVLAIKAATRLSEVHGVKAMQGDASAFRIRVGNYRIGARMTDGGVLLQRFLHRRDIYRYFP